MRYNRLGKGGPEFSILGFGTWVFGEMQRNWRLQDDLDMVRALHCALDSGINWIDTAPVYGDGHAEQLMGRALTDTPRDQYLLAGKCGLSWTSGHLLRISLRPQDIRAQLEQTLSNLQTDYLDLYQHHLPDPGVPLEDSWGEMLRLQEEGKVRYIGLCNYDIGRVRKCAQIGTIQSVQQPYSMIHREIQEDLLPFCSEEQIGFLPYSPLQKSALLQQLDMDALRSDAEYFQRMLIRDSKLPSVKDLMALIKPAANRLGCTVAQFAIAWILSYPQVTSAIITARNPEHVRELLDSDYWQLSTTDMEEVGEYIAETVGI